MTDCEKRGLGGSEEKLAGDKCSEAQTVACRCATEMERDVRM